MNLKAKLRLAQLGLKEAAKDYRSAMKRGLKYHTEIERIKKCMLKFSKTGAR